MAILLVQAAPGIGFQYSPSIVTFTNPIGAGHLLEIIVQGSGTGTPPNFTVTDSSGSGQIWHFAVGTSATGTFPGAEKYYCYSCASGSYSITVTNNSSGSPVNFECDALEWSGILATSNPLDQVDHFESAGSGTVSGNPVTTTANGELISATVFSTADTSGFPQVGTGFTSAYLGSEFRQLEEYMIQATAGSVTASGVIQFSYYAVVTTTYFAAGGGGGGIVAEDDGPRIAYSFASDLGLYVPRGSVDELPIAGTALAAEEATGPLIWMPVDYGSVPEPATDELPAHPFEESSLTIRPSDDVAAPARQVNSDDVSGTLFAALEGEGSTFLPPQTIDASTLPEPCEDHFSGVRGLEESSLAISSSVVDPIPIDPSPEDQLNAFVSPLEEASPPPAVPASPDLPFLPEPSDDFPPPAASTLAVEEWSPPVPAQPVVEIPPVRAQEDTVHTSVASIAAEEQGAVLTLADAWQGAPYASQEELPAQAALDDASRPYSFAQDPQPASMFSPGEDVLGQIAIEEASPKLVSPSDASPTSYFSTGNDERLQTALADESGYIWPQSSVEVPSYPASREDWMASPPSPFGLDDAQSAILWPQDLDQWRATVASIDDEFFKLVATGINLPGAICSTMPSISVTCAAVPSVSVTCQTVGIAPAP